MIIGGKRRDVLRLSYDGKLLQVQVEGNKGKDGESFGVDMKGLEVISCDGQELLVYMLDWMKVRPDARLDAAVTERWRIGHSSEDHQGTGSDDEGYEVKR